MKKIGIILIFIFSVQLKSSAQTEPDTIINSNTDTIHCLITWVNDQNIFFTRNKIKTYIPRKQVVYYKWNSEFAEPVVKPGRILYPYDTAHSVKFGVGIIKRMDPIHTIQLPMFLLDTGKIIYIVVQ